MLLYKVGYNGFLLHRHVSMMFSNLYLLSSIILCNLCLRPYNLVQTFEGCQNMKMNYLIKIMR